MHGTSAVPTPDVPCTRRRCVRPSTRPQTLNMRLVPCMRVDQVRSRGAAASIGSWRALGERARVALADYSIVRCMIVSPSPLLARTLAIHGPLPVAPDSKVRCCLHARAPHASTGCAPHLRAGIVVTCTQHHDALVASLPADQLPPPPHRCQQAVAFVSGLLAPPGAANGGRLEQRPERASSADACASKIKKRPRRRATHTQRFTAG